MQYTYLLCRRSTPALAVSSRSESSLAGRMVKTKTLVHITDLAAESAYIEERASGLCCRRRTRGCADHSRGPMLKEDELIGVFTVYRQEFAPLPISRSRWSRAFADQAVIAIENARLLKELRERTEQVEVQSRSWSTQPATRTARHRPSRRNRTHGQAAALPAAAGG